MIRQRDEAKATPRTGVIGTFLYRLHLDTTLLALLMILMGFGVIVIYSAVGQDAAVLQRQLSRVGVAICAMFVFAQISPGLLRRAAPWIYAFGTLLLVLVLVGGDMGKGAQRWLDVGVRFQPSEIMKLAVPALLAWFLHERRLPPSPGVIAMTLVFALLPVVLIILQPDLGTSILIGLSGAAVIFLSGIGAAYIAGAAVIAAASIPAMWYFVMHEYQKQRVLTLFNPEQDPLGSGYHIIQSKIAIGSGGLFGKGWLNGSQGQLEFLPERSTDFIFAVIGEEFGLLGALSLLVLYLLIVGRGLYIAAMAQDTFTRLLAGSLSLTFFFYVFVNTAMVTGLLPVVGVPLPLVSAGGTSMVTLMCGFGILMSIHTHRKLLPR